jgi:hypothetical protein
VVGTYENPTGQVLVNGAMAHITGIIAPDDLSQWPRIDAADPEYQRDMASLLAMGAQAHHHMDGEEEESHAGDAPNPNQR